MVILNSFFEEKLYAIPEKMDDNVDIHVLETEMHTWTSPTKERPSRLGVSRRSRSAAVMTRR